MNGSLTASNLPALESAELTTAICCPDRLVAASAACMLDVLSLPPARSAIGPWIGFVRS